MGAASHFSNALRRLPGDHPNQEWMTPDYVLDPVRRALGGWIELDPCTMPSNPVSADRFYALPDDGLYEDWSAATIYVNPPYGEARVPWIMRCIEASRCGSRVVLLVPAATDTRAFQLAASEATALVFLRGRVKFGTLRPNRRQRAASHPSVLVGWNVDLVECQSLGVRLRQPSARQATGARG